MGGNNWSSTSWGSWQTASYTGTVDNTGGGAFSGSGNSVTAGANSSTSSRSGNLRLSQTRSGIQENGNSWPSPSNINVPLNQSVRLGNLHFVVASVNTPDTWDIEITIKDGSNSIQWLTLNGVFVGQETTEQIPIGNFNIEGHLYGEPTKTVNISPYSGYLSGNTININVSVPY